MLKLKKKHKFLSYFVLLLTFFIVVSCQPKKNTLYQIDAKQINIDKSFKTNSEVENFILPFRNHITNDLNQVLAFNPIDQDKSIGVWETNIGNLLAQATFELSYPIFLKLNQKKLDGCILNHGGIRAIIPKGNVTTKTAFNVMPFENSVVIVALTGNELKNLANYIIAEKKPHPLYGIVIYTDNEAKRILKIEMNDQIVEDEKTYYIATSDYLANGGDNMLFLKESSTKYTLDYKLRNLFIDYFTKIDTLPNITKKHVIIE